MIYIFICNSFLECCRGIISCMLLLGPWISSKCSSDSVATSAFITLSCVGQAAGLSLLTEKVSKWMFTSIIKSEVSKNHNSWGLVWCCLLICLTVYPGAVHYRPFSQSVGLLVRCSLWYQAMRCSRERLQQLFLAQGLNDVLCDHRNVHWGNQICRDICSSGQVPNWNLVGLIEIAVSLFLVQLWGCTVPLNSRSNAPWRTQKQTRPYFILPHGSIPQEYE